MLQPATNPRPRNNRPRHKGARTRMVSIKLTDDDCKKLEAVAAARGFRFHGLAAQLMERIIADNLFAAILD